MLSKRTYPNRTRPPVLLQARRRRDVRRGRCLDWIHSFLPLACPSSAGVPKRSSQLPENRPSRSITGWSYGADRQRSVRARHAHNFRSKWQLPCQDGPASHHPQEEAFAPLHLSQIPRFVKSAKSSSTLHNLARLQWHVGREKWAALSACLAKGWHSRCGLFTAEGARLARI